MSRPPQYRNDDDLPPTFVQIKATIKQMRPEDRATLLAWLALYYDDRGELFSPQIRKQRERVTIGGREFWLVRVRGR
jgi:hypothetical protein